MSYLIDGNNFIGYLSPNELRSPESKRSLASQALIFQHMKRTKVTLVFDGPPDFHLTGKASGRKSFSVFYPPIDQNADSLIKEIIARQTDRRWLFVVSSDREIRSFAQKHKAKTLSCREFNHLLKQTLKRYKKIQEGRKETALPSPLEVNHWLDIFESKND